MNTNQLVSSNSTSPSSRASYTRKLSEDLTELVISEETLTKIEAKEHNWQPETFHSPTICEACGGLLWGISKQGQKCTVCKTVAHSHHKKDIPLCGLLDSKNLHEDFIGAHEFYAKSFNRFTYCNVCRQLLVGLKHQGKCCELCRFVCHDNCKNEAAKLPCLNYAQNQKGESNKPEHFWREGNLSQSLEGKITCLICEKPCGSTQGLIDLFCVWCSKSAHTSCLKSSPEHLQVCSLGQFKKIMIPPSAVSTKESSSENKEEKEKKSINYLIDSTHLSSSNYYPVAILINKRSGGQQGSALIRKFNRYLNPVQVFNIGEGGPKPGLEFMSQLEIPWKAVVCGGDGTVNWVLETIRSMNLKYRPPCAIVPLGTGNDLSRSLGWGPGYEGESVTGILEQISNSKETLLDRWSLDMSKKTGNEYGDFLQSNVMNNYFSIGVDARIALDFHHKREADPGLFKSRTGNKLWYGIFGATAMFNGCSGLHKWLTLEINGKEQVLDKEMEGLIILNVQSYGGGVNMWGKEKESKENKDNNNNNHFQPQSYSDGLLEVVWVKGSSHLGRIQSGLSSAKRLGQGSEILITLKHDTAIPVQIDGEPWMQDSGVKIRLSKLESAKVLIPKGK